MTIQGIPPPPANAKWQQGRVKWFNFKLGYGFVVLPDGTDVFIHATTAQSAGVVQMRPGSQANVLVGNNGRKLAVFDVQMVG